MKRLLLAGVLLLSACGGGSTAKDWASLEVQNVASGQTTVMKAVLKDKPTFITLWSVTCQPCRQEMPWLQEIASNNDKFDVLGVNIGDDLDAIQEFVSEIKVTFPMYRDEVGDMLTALNVTQVPVTFAVNSKGEIVWKNLGAMTLNDLQAQLAKMRA
jgi:thiol-disulfide isomerase/thioredoxin